MGDLRDRRFFPGPFCTTVDPIGLHNHTGRPPSPWGAPLCSPWGNEGRGRSPGHCHHRRLMAGC